MTRRVLAKGLLTSYWQCQTLGVQFLAAEAPLQVILVRISFHQKRVTAKVRSEHSGVGLKTGSSYCCRSCSTGGIFSGSQDELVMRKLTFGTLGTRDLAKTFPKLGLALASRVPTEVPLLVVREGNGECFQIAFYCRHVLELSQDLPQLQQRNFSDSFCAVRTIA